MKTVNIKGLGLFIIGIFLVATMTAQDDAVSIPENKPVKNTFESNWIIDNQTVMVPYKGTFEFSLQHRFGLVENGYEDFFGLYAPGNIRLGFGYVPFKDLMVGFGITKVNLTWDFNAKYALFHQMQNGGMPVSLTYFGNAAMDTRSEDYFTNPDEVDVTDRLSFFHQILVARKFSDKFSFQLAGSLSHFNTVDAYEDPNGEVVQKWNNDHLAIAGSARYHLTPVTSILLNYDQPLTTHEDIDPQPNLSFGVEFVTSSHQFQIFAGNFYNITPQRNNVFNTYRFDEGEFLIGFNLVRLWNF